MRRWARLRTADPPEPEGEPDPEAVQAGGPVKDEATAEHPESPAQNGESAGSERASAEPELEPEPAHAHAPEHEPTHHHLHGHGHHPQQAPSTAAPVVVPRWIQIVVLPLALLGLWALARAAGSVLLVLVVAAVVALILAPTVRLLER
jgi:hypothetical protein